MPVEHSITYSDRT